MGDVEKLSLEATIPVIISCFFAVLCEIVFGFQITEVEDDALSSRRVPFGFVVVNSYVLILVYHSALVLAQYPSTVLPKSYVLCFPGPVL